MGSRNTDEMVKVVFKLEKDEDDYLPADYESVWSLPVGEGFVGSLRNEGARARAATSQDCSPWMPHPPSP